MANEGGEIKNPSSCRLRNDHALKVIHGHKACKGQAKAKKHFTSPRKDEGFFLHPPSLNMC